MTTTPPALDPNTRAIHAAVGDWLNAHARTETGIVDVGCGGGALLEALRARGYGNLTGIGYDITTPAGVPAVSGIDLSREGWSRALGGARFDYVIATEVIEHLINPYQFLCEIRQIANNKGNLLLTFPNVHNLRSIVGYALRGRFSGFFGPNFNDGHPLFDQHIFIPNIHLVSYFLRLAGFDIKDTLYVNGHGRLFSQTIMLAAAPLGKPYSPGGRIASSGCAERAAPRPSAGKPPEDP